MCIGVFIARVPRASAIKSQCTLPCTVTDLLYTPLSVNFEKSIFCSRLQCNCFFSHFIAHVFMATKRRPNSERNPPPKMPASCIDFSVWKTMVLKIWRSPTSPKIPRLSPSFSYESISLPLRYTADLEPAGNEQIAGHLFIFFRFTAGIHRSFESVNCPWSIHLCLFRAVRALSYFQNRRFPRRSRTRG